MKKTLLIFSLIFAVLFSTKAQRRISIFEVPNKTTEFGITLPVGTVIYETDSLKFYRLTARCVDSLTMADVFTSGNYSGLFNQNGLYLLSSDTANWNASYDFTSAFSESDPVYAAWNKSTGISIAESQISDLQSYALATHNHTGTYAPINAPTFTDTVTAPVIKLPSNGRLILTLPDTDTHTTGKVTNSIQSGYTATAYDLIYLGSGGKWLAVDADTISTCNGMLAVALEAKNDTQEMLVALPGTFIKNTSWSWTVGATLYAGETTGVIQEALPSGANNVIRVIGFAINATTIYFNPSSDYQTIVE